MKQVASLALLIVAGTLCQISLADKPTEKPAQKAARKPPSSLEPIQDVRNLPRVLLIGDSISIGYTVPTRELLAGKANVHRILTNGGPTINGLKNLDAWLGNGKWDVIHFNWGLHDLRKDDGKHQVPIDQYEQNLRELAARLKATGAKLIWCSTTPVPAGAAKRESGDELKYNAVAKKVMEENGIAIDDLYAFAEPQSSKIQLPANVHYSDEGSQVLAQKVVASILEALGKTEGSTPSR